MNGVIMALIETTIVPMKEITLTSRRGSCLYVGGTLIVDMRHRTQAFFRLRIISEKPGLLPYINIYTLKILIERNSPTIMESPNTPILVMICQKGISDTPNLNMV